MNPREVLLRCLEELRASVPKLANGMDGGIGGFREDTGICPNVAGWLYRNHYDEIYDNGELRVAVNSLLLSTIQTWPGARKEIGRPNRTYPVGGREEYSDSLELGTLWQNPRRIELLDYLIEEMKK